MLVKEIMTKAPACSTPETKLREIAREMLTHDCGAIPICDGTKMVGLVTDRDIVCRGFTKEKNPSELCARDVMSTKLTTVDENDSIQRAVTLMTEQKVRRGSGPEGGSARRNVVAGRPGRAPAACRDRCRRAEAFRIIEAHRRARLRRPMRAAILVTAFGLAALAGAAQQPQQVHADAATGRAAFITSGCAECHRVSSDSGASGSGPERTDSPRDVGAIDDGDQCD